MRSLSKLRAGLLRQAWERPTKRSPYHVAIGLLNEIGIAHKKLVKGRHDLAALIADGHTWAMACGARLADSQRANRAQKPSLSSAECPEDALIRMRRVRIVGEVRLILIRSRENRQQVGKR